MAAWNPEANDIFLKALEIRSPDGRRVYLDEACHDDTGLRVQVEALLAASERAGTFLESPAADLMVTIDEPITEGLGTVIGPYKLMEQIGEGGMGLVFVAEQQHPVRRKVALKVIKPGMDTREVIARFEAERQALALMDHPNIAKVHDGGATPSGRPYFVMELVKGVPITQFCDENHLTPRERLELFVAVCQAVQHAHHKGIIHRDVKPSNVLVTSHDGTPVVKVIDFGVAKAIGQQLTDKTVYTGFSQMLGTPLYMSPEQAGMSGLDIDTRTDIYALGVLLYELLTGTTPFDKERLKGASYDEMRRIIREAEPPKPSTRVSTLGQAASTVSVNRQSDPRRLSQLCRGELDWIVMKALEKDRNHRYETASAFAADLQRYLHDEPVLACPPSAGYRLRKFARRNKRALATGALLGVTLLIAVGAVAGSIGWILRDQATRQAVVAAEVKQALREIERLEGQARWSEALFVANHAQSLLSSGGSESLDRQVQEHLDDLRLLVQAEKARFRKTQVDPRSSGFVYELALPDYARAFAEWGISEEKTTPDQAGQCLTGRPDPIHHALLGALYDWHSVASAHKPATAEWLGRVLALVDDDPWRSSMREALGKGDRAALQKLADEVDVARQPPELLANLALSHIVGREAVPRPTLLLRRAQRHYPADFWINYNLGYALLYLSDPPRPEEAARYYGIALGLRPCAGTYCNFAHALSRAGEFDTAVALYQKALALEPNYAVAHLELGNVYVKMGRTEEAIASYRESIRASPTYSTHYYLLGNALRRQGRLDLAVVAYRECLRLNPDSFDARYFLGHTLRAQGLLDEAITVYQEFVGQKTNKSLGRLTRISDIAWYVAESSEPAPRVRQRARQLADAVRKASRDDPELQSQDAGWLEIAFQDGAWLLLLGDRAGYRRLCAESLAQFGRTTDPRTAYLLARLCGLDVEPAASLDHLTHLARLAVDVMPAHCHFHGLGLIDYRAGRTDEAIRRFQQSLDDKPPWEANALNQVGMALALHKAGRSDDARKWLEKARESVAASPLDLNSNVHPHDRRAGQLLLREAEELFGK
jgi:serine/threonine protein kinase/Flp pilus assembly protein TadD